MITRRDALTGAAAVAAVAALTPPAEAASRDFVQLVVYVRHDDPTVGDLASLCLEFDRASHPSLASKAREFIAWNSEDDPTAPPSSFSWYSGRALYLANHFCEPDRSIDESFKPGFFNMLAFTGRGSIPKHTDRFFAADWAAILDRVGEIQEGVALRRAGIDEELDRIEVWGRLR